jgi:hypothetical protein
MRAIAISSLKDAGRGKLAGFAIGLITSACSMAWNIRWSPRIGISQFNSYSLAAAILTTLCAWLYWSRKDHNAGVIRGRLVSTAFAGAFVTAIALLVFSWWWFPAAVIRSIGVRQSILKFAACDFALMFGLLLSIGYSANRAFSTTRLRKTRHSSN